MFCCLAAADQYILHLAVIHLDSPSAQFSFWLSELEVPLPRIRHYPTMPTAGWPCSSPKVLF
jgi:hypothetical protein